MNLKTAMEEIRQNRRAAQIDLSTVEPRFRAGHEARKAEAIEKVDGLNKQYGQLLTKNPIGIFIFGPHTQELLEFAHKEANVLTVDASVIYERIASNIETTIPPSRVFTSDCAFRFIGALEDLGRELDIASMKEPSLGGWIQNITLKSHCDVVEFVRNRVREVMGDSLNHLAINKQMVENALACEFDQNVIPVFIKNVTKEEIAGELGVLFFPDHYKVAADSLDTNKIIRVFKQIRAKVSKQNTQE